MTLAETEAQIRGKEEEKIGQQQKIKTKREQLDFPGSSAGKKSTCNAGDPSLIPGSGRSTGEGISYPLHYSWASLVAQLVKNPPAMQETPLGFLG